MRKSSRSRASATPRGACARARRGDEGERRTRNVQERLSNLAYGASPVGSTVAAVLLLILGVLIVVYPGLLAWLVGIGLVLAGVALLTAAFTAANRTGR